MLLLYSEMEEQDLDDKILKMLEERKINSNAAKELLQAKKSKGKQQEIITKPRKSHKLRNTLITTAFLGTLLIGGWFFKDPILEKFRNGDSKQSNNTIRVSKRFPENKDLILKERISGTWLINKYKFSDGKVMKPMEFGDTCIMTFLPKTIRILESQKGLIKGDTIIDYELKNSKIYMPDTTTKIENILCVSFKGDSLVVNYQHPKSDSIFLVRTDKKPKIKENVRKEESKKIHEEQYKKTKDYATEHDSLVKLDSLRTLNKIKKYDSDIKSLSKYVPENKLRKTIFWLFREYPKMDAINFDLMQDLITIGPPAVPLIRKIINDHPDTLRLYQFKPQLENLANLSQQTTQETQRIEEIQEQRKYEEPEPVGPKIYGKDEWVMTDDLEFIVRSITKEKVTARDLWIADGISNEKINKNKKLVESIRGKYHKVYVVELEARGLTNEILYFDYAFPLEIDGSLFFPLQDDAFWKHLNGTGDSYDKATKYTSATKKIPYLIWSNCGSDWTEDLIPTDGILRLKVEKNVFIELGKIE